MILKFLLIAAVIGVVYFIYMKKKSALQNANKEDKKNKQSNEMVECSTCGIYSELGDALLSNGKYYCSKKCLESVK